MGRLQLSTIEHRIGKS